MLKVTEESYVVNRKYNKLLRKKKYSLKIMLHTFLSGTASPIIRKFPSKLKNLHQKKFIYFNNVCGE